MMTKTCGGEEAAEADRDSWTCDADTARVRRVMVPAGRADLAYEIRRMSKVSRPDWSFITVTTPSRVTNPWSADPISVECRRRCSPVRSGAPRRCWRAPRSGDGPGVTLAHADVDIAELAEPELLLLDHPVLEHQVAGGVGGGDRHREGGCGVWGQVGGQVEALVGVPGVGAETAAGIGEVDAQVDGVGTAGGPGLSAGVGDRDGVGFGLAGGPGGRGGGAVAGRPAWWL